MGFLKSIFGESNSEEIPVFNWIPLTEINQLEEITLNSKKKPQVIFKHSTRCGISRSVLKKFERNTSNNTVDFYYLDLLNFRNISNEIASKFQVIHQSPQLLVIKDGVVAVHDSHYDIMSVDLT